MVRSITYPLHDFSNYYFGAKLLSQGLFTSDVYDPGFFNLKINSLGPEGLFVNYAPNTPFLVLFYVPMTLVGPFTAKAIFNVVSVFLFIISIHRLSRKLNISQWLLIFLPIVFAVPIKNNILFGQPYLLIFCLMSEGFIAHCENMNLKASFVWAISALLKITPAIILIYLLLKKKYRAFIWFNVLGLIMILLTLMFVDLEVYYFYLDKILPKVSMGELVSTGYYFPQQTSLSLFKHLFLLDNPGNLNPWLNNPWLFTTSLSLFVGLILSVLIVYSRTEKSDFIVMSVWIAASFLISTYGSSYSRILLLFFWFALYKNSSTHRFLLVTSGIFLIVNFPYGWLENYPIVVQFFGLLTLTLLLLNTVYIQNNLKRLLQLSPILCGLIFLVNLYRLPVEQPEGKPLLSDNVSLLLDYNIQGDSLHYTYWNGRLNHGIFKEKINTTSNEVVIQYNQIIWKGKKLTNSVDNKKDPLIINGNKIIYLSDAGRGYGFYTLSYIKLPNDKIEI
ncbi:MAG: DUF2029 domain-containing protein [Cyclobacteriaceae bacterium]